MRAGDPESHVPTWLRGEAPTGVSERIPASGVFPHVETEALGTEELHKVYDTVEPVKNYKSTEEHAEFFRA